MRPTTWTSLELPVCTSIEPEPVSTCRLTVPLTLRVRSNSPRADAAALALRTAARIEIERNFALKEEGAGYIVPPRPKFFFANSATTLRPLRLKAFGLKGRTRDYCNMT